MPDLLPCLRCRGLPFDEALPVHESWQMRFSDLARPYWGTLQKPYRVLQTLLVSLNMFQKPHDSPSKAQPERTFISTACHGHIRNIKNKKQV